MFNVNNKICGAHCEAAVAAAMVCVLGTGTNTHTSRKDTQRHRHKHILQKPTKWHTLDKQWRRCHIVDDRLAFDNNNKSYSLTDSSIVHSFNEWFVLSKCVLVVRIWCDFGRVCGFADGEMLLIFQVENMQ